MATLQRQRIQWTGFPGGPGVTTLYFLDAPGAQAAVNTFFAQMVQEMPSGVRMTIEAGGDTIDSSSGNLTGSWSGTAGLTALSTATESYAAPVGFQVQWLTTSVVNGHRVRGRSFIVPSIASIFDTNGSLDDSAVIAFQDAANVMTLALADNFMVWSRPQDATPSWTDVHGRVHPARAARSGAASPVIAPRVPDKAIVLRSRRD